MHERKYVKTLEEGKLRKDIISHISNFVYYRDEMINILRIYFKEDKLCTSTEKLNEIFDNINKKQTIKNM